jgi:hypothetical protein
VVSASDRAAFRIARALLLVSCVAAMAVPAQAHAADAPPSGRGLMISGGIVGGIGVAMLVPGVVFLVTGRTSREGLATAIGAMLTGVGVACIGAGTGLLVPGVMRHRRHQAWQAEQATTGDRVGPAPGGFILRF